MDEETPILPQLSKPDQLEQQVREDSERRVKTGAHWFYWIAGLSGASTIIIHLGGDWRFFIGLGITTIVDVAARQMGAIGGLVPLTIDMLIVGIFVLFGLKAAQRSKAAFITGMIVYALDGVLLLVLEDFRGAIFHGIALYYIFKGFSAVNELRAMEPTRVPAGLSDVKLD